MPVSYANGRTHGGPGGGAKALLQCFAGQHGEQRFAQALWSPVYQIAVFVRRDDLRHGADRRADRGEAAGHAFQRGARPAFVERGADHDAGGIVRAGHRRLVRQPAQEAHVLLEPTLRNVPVQRLPERALTNDVQGYVRLLPPRQRQRVQQQKEPFVLHQAADDDDVGLLGDRLGRKRVEVQVVGRQHQDFFRRHAPVAVERGYLAFVPGAEGRRPPFRPLHVEPVEALFRALAGVGSAGMPGHVKDFRDVRQGRTSRNTGGGAAVAEEAVVVTDDQAVVALPHQLVAALRDEARAVEPVAAAGVNEDVGKRLPGRGLGLRTAR